VGRPSVLVHAALVGSGRPDAELLERVLGLVDGLGDVPKHRVHAAVAVHLGGRVVGGVGFVGGRGGGQLDVRACACTGTIIILHYSILP
jgi:hypothetical protein